MAAEYPALVRNELTDAKLSYQVKPNSLIRYFSTSNQFMGLHKSISLYAQDSPYKDEQWVVSVMVPAKDYEKALDNLNQRLILFLSVLLVLGIGASFWFSKFYLKPITETINKVKQTKASEIEKTNILEIDDLLEFSPNKTAKLQLKIINPIILSLRPVVPECSRNFWRILIPSRRLNGRYLTFILRGIRGKKLLKNYT